MAEPVTLSRRRCQARRRTAAGRALLLVTLALALLACADRGGSDAGAPAAPCEADEIRRLAQELGGRMRAVSLLAPERGRARELEAQYAPLVTPALLERWRADPTRAPGRQVSSPWPRTLEVRSVHPTAAGTCEVEGDVVYVTSADTLAVTTREPVTLTIDPVALRISAFARAPADAATRKDVPSDRDAAGATTPSAAAAVAVIREYYAAIAARDYADAYALWSGGGEASGQTLAEFATGFAATASVTVEPGTPGRIEGAAGSRYLTVPVTVRARTTSGEQQRFTGSYTLRRSVVAGATAEQRAWRIHAANLARRP